MGITWKTSRHPVEFPAKQTSCVYIWRFSPRRVNAVANVCLANKLPPCVGDYGKRLIQPLILAPFLPNECVREQHRLVLAPPEDPSVLARFCTNLAAGQPQHTQKIRQASLQSYPTFYTF